MAEIILAFLCGLIVGVGGLIGIAYIATRKK